MKINQSPQGRVLTGSQPFTLTALLQEAVCGQESMPHPARTALLITETQEPEITLQAQGPHLNAGC